MPDDGLTLRVMTFNLRGAGYPQDAPNSWSNRADLNVRTIRKYNPDLIGFQELQEGNLRTYRQQLGEYQWVLGKPSNEPGFYNYNAIYWKAEHFELLESGGMWLSETPHTWSKSWDAVFVRCANWVRLRARQNGVELLHFNTHLDHVGVQARVNGSRQIIAKARELSQGKTAVIVSGDFNSIPWLPESGLPGKISFDDTSFHLFSSSGFRDAFLETGQSDTAHTHTYHGYQGEGFSGLQHGMAQRIDWILLSDGESHLEAKNCQTARDSQPPIYPSDHYPVIADLWVL